MYKKCICCVYHVHLSLYSVGRQNKFYEKKYENNKINSGGERGKSADLRLAPPLAQVVR